MLYCTSTGGLLNIDQCKSSPKDQISVLLDKDRVAGSTTLSFRPDIKRLDQDCQVGARRDVITVSETSEELASKAEPSLYFKKSKFPEFGEARRDYPGFQRELCMCVSPHYDQVF